MFLFVKKRYKFSSCSCKDYLKDYMCQHIVVVLLSKKSIQVPEKYLDSLKFRKTINLVKNHIQIMILFCHNDFTQFCKIGFINAKSRKFSIFYPKKVSAILFTTIIDFSKNDFKMT
ncbi:hypothetical protein BpHYR1_053972 [Brachionus plicatilis]|uniref:SWIM-type domain-containing protein n=1 Tax=Brachionus plicatilis TaxID=10195 RepID=A0A3M7PPC6_BRAPC|nr:hypothetical protein BpHYR1_053972 [Brachionus plicatilis]